MIDIDEYPEVTKDEQVYSLMLQASTPYNGPSTVTAIEFRRTQYELSKAQMAKILGITGAHYTEFVQGKRGLGTNAMRRAYAIGVPPNALLQMEQQR